MIPILDIDVEGVRQVKTCEATKDGKLSPYFVFIAPPSIDELASRLRDLYPMVRTVSGEDEDKKRTRDLPRAYCLLAMQQLGLRPHAIDDTLRANVDSLVRLGLLSFAEGGAKL